MGATEAHNWHLPYGTDSFQNVALCSEAGRRPGNKGPRWPSCPTSPSACRRVSSTSPSAST
ncbi:hypothetical protein [Verrucomicrobium spinosum]|uniref:hypothetical protein n=1 Tax=Verrucomicrobium spinosum TaxID=2736 RepID=UPI0031B6468F